MPTPLLNTDLRCFAATACAYEMVLRHSRIVLNHIGTIMAGKG